MFKNELCGKSIIQAFKPQSMQAKKRFFFLIFFICCFTHSGSLVGVGSIMCSYNRIGDIYACENNETLNTDLKGKMGYAGFVVSDWGATHSTVYAANNGLDMEMPDDSFFGSALMAAVKNGLVSIQRLNDMIIRALSASIAVGSFDKPPSGNLNIDARSPNRIALARTLAAAGTVLLKNDPAILPLASTIKSIAVSGDVASIAPMIAGGGSGHVNASYIVTPLEGITERAGTSVSITYASTSEVSEAATNAASADIAIVFVGVESSEGSDRPDLNLSADQNSLVSAVAAAQSNTVVVVHSPGAVLMPWADDVPAIICAFFPGQEDGSHSAQNHSFFSSIFR
jgi:beta-glucosidase